MKVYVVEECFKCEGGSVEAIFYSEDRAIKLAKYKMGNKNLKVETFNPESKMYNDRRITYIEHLKESRMTFYTVEEFDIIRDEEYVEGT